jgi:hypothetical protein
MSNTFLQATIKAINRNGVDLKYKSSERVIDEIEGTVTNSVVEYTCRIYPKQIQANQYNFPTLVGKEVVMFYLANSNLGFQVKVSDNIEYKGNLYRINSYQEHIAKGQVCLYRILGVKG